MRIDAYNQISQLYQASKPKKITKKSEATVKEQYTVSSKGQDYQAKKALAAAPDIREEKVAALKEQIASGSYNVSAQEIADSVVSKFFDSSI
jgi:negative regulator of flagellin synthesis FlgM